ncbi:hypothetical protein QBC35DRAFT_505972 [Podospora australis]|uniref:DUF7932 domain-containing protein n=1 Tax=Podospora australis TaxID=1536484 RepID=A0AAN6WLP7_9PEZI|nr:hypothetical protein QBC35DRAFT_505972 [Podospora australis]
MANTVLLSAQGENGLNGTQQWDGSTFHQAPQGCPGRHGRDASFPTAGLKGGEIHVNLGFSPDRPGFIQVLGEAHRMGSRWEVSGQQALLMDCRGGNGGDGGIGERGQNGGDGFNGRAATRTSEATDGSPGMNGGDGGRGTSGANGGPGGSAHVTVNEEDLDTLIGLQWDVRGGLGGAPGDHGDGGDGGHGGAGGASCSWTESVPYEVRYDSGGYSHTEYRTRYHSRPAGRGGPGGMGGRRHTDLLYPGQDGPVGFSEVTVFYRDGRRAVYPSRYILEVVEFKVADENDDGINEPGEFLIVSDIIIKNTGKMPSPRTAKLQVLIRATKWLDPVLEPLELPCEIPPGHSVRVPGTLRAFIKNETVARESGTLLRAKDTVSLRAYSMRLQRDVPEFRGGVDITCQYPLLMTTPKYLDCVAKGDIVRFSWTIQNISKKSQGRVGTLRRETGTHLSDPKGIFDFHRASKETPHDIMDMIDTLDPGETIPITVDFQVSELVNEFTTGNMLVNLMLSDPHTKEMRNVVSFDLRIQISPSYRYNPAARFLLVINGSSPNAFVIQILHFIQFGLQLPVDIFNLSLSGAFETADTREDMLCNYTGKTIIFLGNTMNYFQNGTRDPWELLDIGQAFSLAQQGTNFMVIWPSNMKSLQGFAHLLGSGIPYPDEQEETAVNATNIKDLLTKLAPGPSPSPGLVVLPVKKKVMRNLEKTLVSTAKTTQQKLTQTFPLRKFLIGTISPIAADPKAKQGALAIAEGLSHQTKLLATLQPMQPVPAITEYNIVMIAHSLPFADRCGIFWNLAGIDCTFGVDITVAYKGDRLAHLGAFEEKDKRVSGKALEALSWSISTQISSELSHFRFGSGSSNLPLLSQLPLLHKFITSAPKALTPEVGASFSPLLTLLGHLRAVVAPLTFGQKFGASLTGPGKRRKKLRNIVVSSASDPLVKLCNTHFVSAPKPSKAEKKDALVTKQKPPSEEVADAETLHKKSLAEIRKQNPNMNCIARAHELACQVLEQLSKTPSARFVDVINSPSHEAGKKENNHRTVTVLSREKYAQLKQQHASRRQRLIEDVDYSYHRLRGMVTKTPALTQQQTSSSSQPVSQMTTPSRTQTHSPAQAISPVLSRADSLIGSSPISPAVTPGPGTKQQYLVFTNTKELEAAPVVVHELPVPGVAI